MFKMVECRASPSRVKIDIYLTDRIGPGQVRRFSDSNGPGHVTLSRPARFVDRPFNSPFSTSEANPILPSIYQVETLEPDVN